MLSSVGAIFLIAFATMATLQIVQPLASPSASQHCPAVLCQNLRLHHIKRPQRCLPVDDSVRRCRPGVCAAWLCMSDIPVSSQAPCLLPQQRSTGGSLQADTNFRGCFSCLGYYRSGDSTTRGIQLPHPGNKRNEQQLQNYSFHKLPVAAIPHKIQFGLTASSSSW